MRGRKLWLLQIGVFCVFSQEVGAVWFNGVSRTASAADASDPVERKPGVRLDVDVSAVTLAPYVWKRTGSASTARAEATMPGAYLRTVIEGSSTISLLIDGTANNGCPVEAMPVVDFSVDYGPYQSVRLVKTGEVYALPLAENLDRNVPHRLEVHFRSAALGPARWQASTVHLRIAGFELEQGGTLAPDTPRRKLAIGFGDSITEGVCNEGSCPYYSNLLMNNARSTWFPLVCSALDCEYGQLGTGGQGMVRPIEIPPLPQTWDHFDAATSRLTDGLLLPEPDYVFCAMGTNDFRMTAGGREHLDISEAYTGWLAALRKACPHAQCFCVVPPLGWHSKEIAAAVTARNQSGDRGVHLIDTAPLKAAFHESRGTQLAADGVHPSVYGNAMLAALIAVEVQKTLRPAIEPEGGNRSRRSGFR
jgi:hypothetical protein